MSHFTCLETIFQNLFYLKQTLEKKNMIYKVKQVTNPTLKTVQTNLIVSQSSNPDIVFGWNGIEYDFIIDNHLWSKKKSPIRFQNKILKQYAKEVIITESRTMGFQPVRNQKNSDGSSTITLERCNIKTLPPH